VNIDERRYGGARIGGKQGRGTENKVVAAIAVEINEGKVGRMRITYNSVPK
jgi:hypothetical protein